MRIVHALGWYFPDSLGGTEVYVAAVARELRRAGVDVRIAAPSPGAAMPTSYLHDGVPVFRYPIPERPTRAEARGEAAVRGVDALYQWLEAERPDVVHMHTFVTGLDLLEVERARQGGARVFVTSHSSALGYVCLRGTLMHWGHHLCDGVTDARRCAACALQARGISRPVASAITAIPPALSRLADRLDHPMGTAFGLPFYVESRMERQRRLFDGIDGFFALTNAARAILVANGAPAQKVHVNRLGVDTEIVRPTRVPPSRDRRPITIGYLGRLDPIKGVDDLLRAAQSLEPGVPFRLEIRGAGHGRDGEQMQRLCVAAAQQHPRVSFGGPVSRADVGAVLASWDVVCCPGRSLEGGPTVALEAFAVGTPVFGTRIGGLAELLTDGDNGRLVEPGDWRALAAVIREVSLHPQLLDEWRAKLPAPRSMRDVASDYLTAYSA